MSRAGGLAAVLAVALCAAPALPRVVTSQGCGTYLGFDTRLSPKAIGRLPPVTDRVTGFEIRRGVPVVAIGSRVLSFGEGGTLEVSVGGAVRALAVDGAGELWLQTAAGVSQVTAAGLRDTAVPLPGTLYGSGGTGFVEVRDPGGSIRVLGTGGRYFEVVALGRPPRAVSWSADGLSLVAGQSLVTWAPGGTQLEVAFRDPALETARDVAAAGPRASVVALADAVLLVAGGVPQILVAGFPARVRIAGDLLFVLDEESGLLWRATGLRALLTRGASEAHARRLLGATPRSAQAFAEAARLVGCDAALRGSSSPVAAPAGGRGRMEATGIALSPTWLTAESGSGLLLRVTAGSAAAAAGLASGDKLIAIAGRPVDGIDAADTVLSSVRAGSAVAISVLRNGGDVSAHLVLP